MKTTSKIIFFILIFSTQPLLAQTDTLNYSITSLYKTGKIKQDRTELSTGIILNEFYEDGEHYYWTMILTPDEKEKEIYTFEYSEPYNFNSTLTIKKYNCSYSQTYSGFNTTYYGSTNTTTTITTSQPTRSISKIIKVTNDNAIVYRYTNRGDLLWTECYDKNGTLQYRINSLQQKYTYKIVDSTIYETLPSGEIHEYKTGDAGISDSNITDGYYFWVGCPIIPKIEIPKYRK